MRLATAFAAATLAFCAGVAAVESDPLPVPSSGPRQKAVTSYNDGVVLLLQKRYADARVRFETAIAAYEPFAEAHNNLAYSIRMQDPRNAEAALRHYARALEIDPKLARAYMYRGMLYTQLGAADKAKADLAVLRPLDAGFAAKLEEAIARAAAKDERDGIAPQLDSPY